MQASPSRRHARSMADWRKNCSGSDEMRLEIAGEETFEASVDALWRALNDPAVLQKCIPGCKEMIPQGADKFKLILNLKVASVGGSFEGAIALSDKQPPVHCKIVVSGSGTLGHAKGAATL